MPLSFKKTYTFQQRKDEALRTLQHQPDHIPLVCEKEENSDIVAVNRCKLLVPKVLLVGQLLHVLRSRLKLPSEKAIFILINDEVPSNSSPLSTVYDVHKDEDGFLYIKFMGENAFGLSKEN
ncbi:autophagy protein [Nannizzia gypsea CBS 118893]|uniref:Autophagy-related protein n=1 Tax=Arthroderma gypseum (strain ATCC MYA-4604 / CBS 118893) TaxID=535722 RepID=E5R1A9_ARTGP|nr:autophagy protein [Nannizzia gypsea CBS 118893]EFQ97660.1 autophagy protein [Nannizzia gypsea CBS 118893]